MQRAYNPVTQYWEAPFSQIVELRALDEHRHMFAD